MNTLFLAAGLLGTLMSPPERPVGVFTADLKGVFGLSGTATITVDDQRVKFSVQMAGVSGVTHVILLSGVNQVQLHASTASRGDAFDVSGEVPAAAVTDITLAELTERLAQGKTEVVIFAEKFPSGNIRGALKGAVVDVPDEPRTPPVTASYN